MAKVIDGKALSERIIQKITDECSILVKNHAIKPGLAVIIVGQNKASKIYVASKARKAQLCGFHSVIHELAETTSETELIQLIKQLNQDPLIHGILVQLPLPEHIQEQMIIQAISPDKDVDGFHQQNVGKLALQGVESSGFIPCTPAGIMMMIETIHGKDLSGMDAVIVGRSNIVGKPMAHLLLSANATTTIAHSQTRDLPEVIRSADILIVAVGKAEMVKGNWIKPGATIIDVGINHIPSKKKGEPTTHITGDVDFDTASIVAGHITPVPGGVGPMTIALLMTATLKAACRSVGAILPKFDHEVISPSETPNL